MRSARREWLHEVEIEELEWTRKDLAESGFWNYVDSQQNHRGHPGPCPTRLTFWGEQNLCTVWPHVRGTNTCLAAASSGAQCAQPPRDGVPFCEFHLDRAWVAMLAFITKDRQVVFEARAEYDRQRIYQEAQLDVAAVRDAQRVLARDNERVYFFLVDHAVKIGRSINPERRVRTLGTTKAPKGIRPDRGSLIGTIPGGAHTESRLHRQFGSHRLIGEWFRYEPIRDDLARIIEERNQQVGAA